MDRKNVDETVDFLKSVILIPRVHFFFSYFLTRKKKCTRGIKITDLKMSTVSSTFFLSIFADVHQFCARESDSQLLVEQEVVETGREDLILFLCFYLTGWHAHPDCSVAIIAVESNFLPSGLPD